LNHIERKEYPNFSQILIDLFQPQVQFQFSLPTFYYNEIPLFNVEEISSNISESSELNLSYTKQRNILNTQAMLLAGNLKITGASSIQVQPVRQIKESIVLQNSLNFITTELQTNTLNSSFDNLTAATYPRWNMPFTSILH
jgi:hypothetical protein